MTEYESKIYRTLYLRRNRNSNEVIITAEAIATLLKESNLNKVKRTLGSLERKNYISQTKIKGRLIRNSYKLHKTNVIYI